MAAPLRSGSPPKLTEQDRRVLKRVACKKCHGSGSLVPMKGNLNITAYNVILDNSVPPTLWQQFGEDLSCFSMTMPPCTKWGPYRNGLSRSVMKELDWLAQSPALNPIEHLGGELERRLQARPNRPTSVPNLTNACGWLEASPRSNVPTSSRKHSQRSGGCYSSKGGTNSILIPIILEWDVQPIGLHIFLGI